MRLHSNFQGGIIDTQVDTSAGGSFTVSSPGFANLPAITAPDLMAIVADPDGLNGAPEVLWVTAHILAATTVTATAAQEGSAGRIHYVDEAWVAPFTTVDLPNFDTAWHFIGAGGEPAFLNSWGNYDAGSYPASRAARFRRLSDGLIVVAGLIKPGASSTTAFTLPAGYRPLATSGINFPVVTNGGVGQIQIMPDGEVIPPSSSSIYCWLDGVSFYAEQ